MHAGQLFSEHFLKTGICHSDAYKRLAGEVSSARDLRQRLADAFAKFPFQASPDEAQTEQDLIFRVLEGVGWNRDLWIVQPRAARKGRSDVPDMLLLPDSEAKQEASAELERDKAYRHGVAIVESKRWDRPLDRATKGTRKGDDEREVPSSQILRYLSRAETLSNRRVQWGILTNGRLWRLYYQGAKSRAEEYLEIDLLRLLNVDGLSDLFTERDEHERDHWLRVFALMFGRLSFVEQAADDRTFHFLALDEGRNWEEQVAKSLSNLVFVQLFPDLVVVLDAADPQRPAARSHEYLRELKEAALTLLYRLLFVLYAEDRDLLPVRDPRYDNYGLSPIRNEIAERVSEKDTFAATISHYYARLRGLFRAIDKGEASLGLPPYNGGLFDPKAAPLLERVDLPDAALAPIVDALSRHGGRRINYRDLSVQQLGSIYERLLEYGLVEQDGRIEVVADEAARKGSGSFYTHEVLVQFILERAVGPLVTDRVGRFRSKAAALASERRSRAERIADLTLLDPASRLLEIKVCDPAMGSGHFLVSLVDFLADRVLEAIADAPLAVSFADDEHPYESPLVERIATIRERILNLARQSHWKLDEAQLDDRHLVRRMILKRVVHGVDKNPMAVELAKVALWLHTFTAGAPLSFLDHHLRCGDSLLGLRAHEAHRWLVDHGELYISDRVVSAQRSAEGMSRLELITDSDIAEVLESAETFVHVRQATAPLCALFDLIQAERVMNIFGAAPPKRPTEARPTTKEKQAAYDRALAFKNVFDGTFGHPIDIARGASWLPGAEVDQRTSLFPPDPPEQSTLFARSAMDPSHRRLANDLVEEARQLAHSHRFLHWELAFPNVWQEWLSVEPKGGFDAVIGNPPYVRQEQIRSLKPALKKAYLAFDGMADLYVYFYELGLRLLRPGGRLSYVVTNKWLRAGYAEELRGLLSSKGWLESVADFGHAKRFFPGADVFPCVIVARRPDGTDGPQQTEVCQIPRDVVRLDRVSQQVSEMAFPLPRASFTKQAWQLDPPEVAALMDKIRRAGVPLEEYAGTKPYRGVLTGFNEAFLIDTPTRDALVAADSKCEEIIKPYLRGQDIERWYAPWEGLWMIFARRGVEIERYPSILARLQQYRNKLEPRPENWLGDPKEWLGRKPGNYAWYEIQDSTEYWHIFNQTKILYQEIQFYARYSLDLEARFANNKTFIIPSSDVYLCAVLNSPLMWWHNWRYLIHLKDEALSPMGYRMENLPVARPSDDTRAAAAPIVHRLTSFRRDIFEARSMLRDWYVAELGISKPDRTLLEPYALSSDEFVEQIRMARGMRRPLSAAGVQAVREEYASTIRPMQVALRESERLEWRLSDLVNEAYGLTSDEVRLMWATAPPRMPLTPEAGMLSDGEAVPTDYEAAE